MGIPVPPAQTLATLIFDGVLEAFPELHIGVIEQGAIWVPSWLRQMESAFEAFHRHEERLQALSLRPSDYVHRQVRFTPYPTEDVGWIVEQAGADLVMFSSDYPHVEGGRKPLERFEASLGDAGDEVRRQFYADNFLFLMGSAAGAGWRPERWARTDAHRHDRRHRARRAGLRGGPCRVRPQLRGRPRGRRRASASTWTGRKVVDLCGGSFDPTTARGPTTPTRCSSSSPPPRAPRRPAPTCWPSGASSTSTPRWPRYWPEFAQAGKEALPVRFLLSHQAGLPAVDRPPDRPKRSRPGTRSSTPSPRRRPSGSPGRRTATTPSDLRLPGGRGGAPDQRALAGHLLRRGGGRARSASSSTSACPHELEPRVSPDRGGDPSRRRTGRPGQRSGGLRPTLLARALNLGGAFRDPGLDEPAAPGTPPRCPAATASPTPPSLSRLYAGLIGTVEGGPPEPLLTPRPGRAGPHAAHVRGRTRSSPRSASPLEQKIGLGFWRCQPRRPPSAARALRPRRAPAAPTASPTPSTAWPWATS